MKKRSGGQQTCFRSHAERYRIGDVIKIQGVDRVITKFSKVSRNKLLGYKVQTYYFATAEKYESIA